MGKNAKIGIAAGAVVAIALVLLLAGNAPLGGGILVLGGLGVAVLYQRLPDDGDAPVRTKPAKGGKGKGKSKLDQALEERLGDAPRNRTAPPASPPSSGGGLPTWSPSGLDTWKPPAESEDETPAIEPARETASAAEWDSWDDDWDTTTATDEVEDDEDENPLAALDRLDEIDPIAEVERLEGLGDEDKTPPKKSGFSFSSAPPVINEETIETADDIMAASEAMELHVEPGGDSELAKLLAKVQARLSAYE